MNSVKIAIEKDVQIDNIYYWTDSKVCLSWINSEKSLNVFVELMKSKGYQTNFLGSIVKAKTIQVIY